MFKSTCAILPKPPKFIVRASKIISNPSNIFPCQAVLVDRTLYISGQLGIGKDGDIVAGGTLAQVSIVL